MTPPLHFAFTFCICYRLLPSVAVCYRLLPSVLVCYRLLPPVTVCSRLYTVSHVGVDGSGGMETDDTRHSATAQSQSQPQTQTQA